MNKLLDNCLFSKDKEQFECLKNVANKFRKKYVGNLIIRDDIFSVITNYAELKNHQLKILKLPIDDEDLWAFTCVKNGIIFVTINTALPFSYQIFAAAHELYHIYKYIENSENDIVENGSILTGGIIDEENISEEDREANAFAALILAPKTQIQEIEKLSAKKLQESNLLFVLVVFMDFFAMPYKAMVLKLFECGHFTKEQAESILQTEYEQIFEDARLHDCGIKWFNPTYENNLDSLKAIVEQNRNLNNITESRAKEDLEFLNTLSEKFQNRKL